MNLITLESDEISIECDVDRGADILSFVDKRINLNLLFSTPWRDRADKISAYKQNTLNFGTFSNWLEGYRGGWQTLCPISGPPRFVSGLEIGFHGEMSLIPWEVVHQSINQLELRIELFTIPITVERKLEVIGNCLFQIDTITNNSAIGISFDYSTHPAFSGAFIEGDVSIDFGAEKLFLDPDSYSFIETDENFSTWPNFVSKDGEKIDLRKLPRKGHSRVVFGWLQDFKEQWASITNHDLGITCRLTWDSKLLPYAWLWQELEGTSDFPWFQRARVIAFEPSSSQTHSAGAKSTIHLMANETIEIPISLQLERVRDRMDT